MAEKRGQLIFTASIIVVLSLGLYTGRNWHEYARLLPRTIGFPVLALAVIYFVLLLIRRGHKAAKSEDTPYELGIAAGSDANGRVGASRILSWLGGFALAIWALGFLWAVPLFVFFYVRFQGREKLFTAILYAAACEAFLLGLFRFIFLVDWPQGVIWTKLGL